MTPAQRKLMLEVHEADGPLKTVPRQRGTAVTLILSGDLRLTPEGVVMTPQGTERLGEILRPRVHQEHILENLKKGHDARRGRPPQRR